MPSLTLFFPNDFADYKLAGETFQLDCPGSHQQSGEWVLGRDPASDLTIEIRNVSRRHAAISYSYAADRWGLQDLKSSEGTFIAGKRLTPGDLHPLNIGDRFYLADNMVNVVEDEHDTVGGLNGPPTVASTQPITQWPPSFDVPEQPPPSPAPPPPARSWADSLYFFLEWTVTAQTRAGKLYRLTVASVLVGLGVLVLHYLTQ
jgi:hypothetical protein